MKRVRGTQEQVRPIEVNVDTVYVRSNIIRIETDDFIGWEYDEKQYTFRGYGESVGELSAGVAEDVDVVAETAVYTAMDVEDLAEMLVYALQEIEALKGGSV